MAPKQEDSKKDPPKSGPGKFGQKVVKGFVVNKKIYKLAVRSASQLSGNTGNSSGQGTEVESSSGLFSSGQSAPAAGEQSNDTPMTTPDKKESSRFKDFFKPKKKYDRKNLAGTGNAGVSGYLSPPAFPPPPSLPPPQKKPTPPPVQDGDPSNVAAGQLPGVSTDAGMVYKVPFELAIDKRIMSGGVQTFQVAYSVTYAN